MNMIAIETLKLAVKELSLRDLWGLNTFVRWELIKRGWHLIILLVVILVLAFQIVRGTIVVIKALRNTWGQK